MLLDRVGFLKEPPYEINAFEWLDTIVHKNLQFGLETEVGETEEQKSSIWSGKWRT